MIHFYIWLIFIFDVFESLIHSQQEIVEIRLEIEEIEKEIISLKEQVSRFLTLAVVLFGVPYKWNEFGWHPYNVILKSRWRVWITYIQLLTVSYKTCSISLSFCSVLARFDYIFCWFFSDYYLRWVINEVARKCWQASRRSCSDQSLLFSMFLLSFRF